MTGHRDPQDCPDAPFEWVDLTEDNALSCAAQTKARALAFKQHPGNPIGMPGSVHLVLMYGVPSLFAGGLSVPYRIARVSACVHGELPTVRIGRMPWAYCAECGIYLDVLSFLTHEPNAMIRGLA